MSEIVKESLAEFIARGGKVVVGKPGNAQGSVVPNIIRGGGKNKGDGIKRARAQEDKLTRMIRLPRRAVTV